MKFANVFLTDPPNITSISFNQTVAVGDVVVLNCTADGNPKPNITWTRLFDYNIVNMPLDITGKQNEGGYRCTAHNGIGNVVTSDVFIAVQCKPILLIHNTVLGIAQYFVTTEVSDYIFRHHQLSINIEC